jgi:hypothetical protein
VSGEVSGDATHLVAEEVDLLESVVGDTPERVRLVPSCEVSASTHNSDDASAKRLRCTNHWRRHAMISGREKV